MGSAPELIYCAKFSLGQFYVAIQMVKLFPGKFWESIINVSLKEDNPNKQVFQLGPLLMQRGHTQKVVHLGCKKIFLQIFFLVFLSQCRVGVVIRNHNY